MPLIATLVGCTFFAKHKQQNETQMEERARENTSAAKVANDYTAKKIAETKVAVDSHNYDQAKLSIEGAQAANSISSEFLRRNLNLMGLPIIDQSQTVANLLSTNRAVRVAEEIKQDFKESQEAKWRQREKELTEQLTAMGQKYEEERNKTIISRIWTWGGWTLVLGGLVALFVFVPVSVPIVARLLGSLIGLFPSLAHGIGVVGKKTAENTFKGIGEIRAQLKTYQELTPDKTYSVREVLELIDTNMKIALDKDDKKVIDSFREKLRV